jgi:hypothetical protein
LLALPLMRRRSTQLRGHLWWFRSQCLRDARQWLFTYRQTALERELYSPRTHLSPNRHLDTSRQAQNNPFAALLSRHLDELEENLGNGDTNQKRHD